MGILALKAVPLGDLTAPDQYDPQPTSRSASVSPGGLCGSMQ